MLKSYFKLTLLLSLSLCFVILLINGCLPKISRAYIEEATMASSVDENQRPVDKTDTFTMDDEVIYCCVKVSNVQRETLISARWILVEGDLEGRGNIEIGAHEEIISESRYVSFGLEDRQATMFPRGSYKVILSVDDKESMTIPFAVEKPPSPQLTILPGKDYSASTDINKVRSYSWTYQGEAYRWDMEITTSIYDYYKAKQRIITSDPTLYSIYITHPTDDEVMSSLASLIKEISIMKGFDAVEMAEFAISFVRSIPYINDLESTTYDEYPRFPIETLVDGRGDCEDSSILLASILRELGIFPVLLISHNHCAVGVSGEGGTDRTFFEYEGRKYYYVEVLKCDLRIGQIPSMFNAQDFSVVPLIPIPLVGHEFSEFRNGRLFRVEVSVRNVGAIPAENVKVFASILSEANVIISQQETDRFSLGVDEEANVTFYLECQSVGRNQLKVTTECSDNRGYVSYQEIECK